MVNTPKKQRVTATRKSRASINGFVAIDACVDQHLSLKQYEAKFGRLGFGKAAK